MLIKEPDGSGTVCSNAEGFFKDIAPTPPPKKTNQHTWQAQTVATVDSLIVSNTQFLFTTKKIIMAKTKGLKRTNTNKKRKHWLLLGST